MKEPAWRHPLLVISALVAFVTLALTPTAAGDAAVARGAVLPAALLFVACVYLMSLFTVPAFQRRWPKGTYTGVAVVSIVMAAPVALQRWLHGVPYWPHSATAETFDFTTTAIFGVLWAGGVVVALTTAFRLLLERLMPERYRRPLLVGSLAAGLAGFGEWMLQLGPPFLEFSGVVPILISTMVFFRQLLATLEFHHPSMRGRAVIRFGGSVAAAASWLALKLVHSSVDTLAGRCAPLFGASFIALAAYVVAATLGDLAVTATARASSVRVRLFVMGVVAVASGAVLHRLDFAFSIGGAPPEVQAGVTLFGNFIVVTSLVTIFGATLATTISRSLERSAKGLEQIRAGNLDVRLDESGNDELAQVARAINHVAAELKETAFLERINAELHSRHTQLTIALQEVQDARVEQVRSERMASVAGLVKGIAHELNNPINYIAGNIGPLQRYTEFLGRLATELADGRSRSTAELEALTRLSDRKDLKFVTEDLARLTADIGEGARRARLIISDLQGLTSAAQRGVEQVDLQRVVTQTVSLLSPTLPPGVKLLTEVEPVTPIAARAGQIEQVMICLVDNAVRAVGDHGTVRIALSEREGRALLQVADDGCGMSEDVKRQAFEPFFTTRSAGEGSGLGLAIVANIVRGHRGAISLESAPGRGSRFDVMLPLETGLAATDAHVAVRT
jgi:signal transduction histidine kinase